MPNFNPFNNDQEDTSFETGAPVSQAVKNVAQAAQKKTDDTAATATKGFGNETDAIVAQLYGLDQPAEPGTDEANQQRTDHTSASAHMASAQSGKPTNVNPNQTPEEQAKMERIRHELFGNYKAKFQSAPNGAQNITTNLDQEMEKARKEREQKEEQRKREQEQEEEEQQRKKKEAQQQELEMPSGKKTGMQMSKPKQEPLALRQAKTKTEIQRGASG